MSRLKWRLETTDLAEYQKTNEYYHCTDVNTFFTLADVWEHLGFKLKRERHGYSGIKGNSWYTLTRMI